MSAVSTSGRRPKLAASRSAAGVARSSGEPGSGGHHLVGRGLDLGLEVSHRP
jgi:hypothetical protein